MLIKKLKYANYGFNDELYDKVYAFFVELNKNDDRHIFWNWARFEWMYGHPDFDATNIGKITLWMDKDKVVGIATYDLYFGEGHIANLPGYEFLYGTMLDYAYETFKDENGFRLATNDENTQEVALIKNYGYEKVDQFEEVMAMNLNENLSVNLPNGFHFEDIDYALRHKEMQWFFWQGFNHGDNREECEKQIIKNRRPYPNFNKNLNVGVFNDKNELVSFCGLWYSPLTDYVYVEPVCTIPQYRGKGLAKAAIYEALNRAKEIGAKKAYVISSMAFYKNLGFAKKYHYSFYWKK